MNPATYTNPLGIEARRTKVLACATVVEEMETMLPDGIQRQVLEFGLHLHPKLLNAALQDAIDASTDVDLILLGYGLCSRSIIGLKSSHATLVVPRTDDCIAIFLGSRDAYHQQMNREPGTYYLTKGWIEAGDTPFEDYPRLVKRYGEEKARIVTEMMLRNYTRLGLIRTGSYDMEKYRDYARRTAEHFGLRFEEIEGAPSLVRKLLFGPWDDEIVVCPPGQAIADEMFWQLPAG